MISKAKVTESNNKKGRQLRKRERGGKEKEIHTRPHIEQSKFRTGFLNINGVKGKYPIIKELISEEQLNLLGIAETKLIDNEPIPIQYIVRKDEKPYIQNGQERGMRGLLIVPGNNITEWTCQETNRTNKTLSPSK